jgi:hypothetical protein
MTPIDLDLITGRENQKSYSKPVNL